MFDIIIANGWVIDGTGNPAFRGDVAVAGERIAEVGSLEGAAARTIIDATGRVVCPGFVDCHSHSDRTILANRAALSSLYQGVTTEIVGNCGMGVAPLSNLNRAEAAHDAGDAYAVDWTSFGEFLDRVEEGIGINMGFQVGHGVLRSSVMASPLDRPPTEGEMTAMERLLAASLDVGGIGLSFGLEFMPGRAADADELRRLCIVAASRHCTTSWHVRNRDRRFEEAVDEALAVTRSAGARLQLSHLSAKPGSAPRAWNRVMEAVRLARDEGQDVQCDMIPYTVGPGELATILPDWASRGTPEEVRARLRDPETRRRLAAESDRYWLLFYYREWDKLTLARCSSHPEWLGMTFREIGAATGQDPFDCVYDILADEAETLSVGVNGVLFSEGDIQEWLADPLFAIAADGTTLPDSGPLTRLANHPNCYGWTPRVVQTLVRELRVLRLEEAIRKMTSMPAARFVDDRGILRRGMVADVIVFDPSRFVTRATFMAPHVYAEGMEYVVVNGRLALAEGAPTGELAGRVLGRRR